MNRTARTISISLATLSLLLPLAATPGFAFTGQEFAKDASVTLDQARAIALKAVPGKITDQELEKERGGSGLRYSFDIAIDGKTHEVGIDAVSGAVLENSID